jgi:hypothetical protein
MSDSRTERIKVTTEVTSNPCELLVSAAEAAARRSETDERGCTLEAMSAILLATFAVEAYLNHLADAVRARDTFARQLAATGGDVDDIVHSLRQLAPELTASMLASNLAKEPMAQLWANERKMTLIDKLRTLMLWLDLPYDKASDPTVQRLIGMSRMRSSLVHGKTTRATSTISKTVPKDDRRGSFEHADANLEPAWQRMSTPEEARRSVAASRDIRKRLSMAAGYGEYHFGLGYLGEVSITRAD